MMSIHGLYVPPGEGRRLKSAAQGITFKVTDGQSAAGSSFEVVVPPGFDVGAHLHYRSEELFYIIEGELEFVAFEPLTRGGHWSDWVSDRGHRPVIAHAGSTLHVPTHCPHAFRNISRGPAKVFFQASPSQDHELYFENLTAILGSGESVDWAAVQELRRKYDIEQITEMRYEPAA
jgi:mannose-6-phosphate isomerase-like protein (cupin superfamily)